MKYLHGICHTGDWWQNTSQVNCSVDELSLVIEGHFAVEFATYSHRSSRLTVANKVYFLKQTKAPLYDRFVRCDSSKVLNKTKKKK